MIGRKGHKKPARSSSYRDTQGRPGAFSYYSSRSHPADSTKRGQAPALPRPALRSFIKHLPSIISALAIAFSLAYMSTLSPVPKVVSVSRSTPSLLRSNQYYQDEAAKILSESIFNKSKLTINSKSVEAAMLARFPELENVSLIIPFAGRRPVIEVQPVVPALVLASEKGAYIIDSNGKAVVEADKATAAIRDKLFIVSDESGLSGGVGKLMLTRDTVSFISHVVQQLEAKRLKIESITLPSIPQEMHIRLKSEGYYIKFNLLGDPRLQSGALLAVRDNLKSNNKKPGEYIDVRVEDKVFYK